MAGPDGQRGKSEKAGAVVHPADEVGAGEGAMDEDAFREALVKGVREMRGARLENVFGDDPHQSERVLPNY